MAKVEVIKKPEVQDLAKRVIDLVASGETPDNAMRLAGANPGVSRGPALRALMQRLNAEGAVSDEIKRAMLQQADMVAWSQLMLTGLAALEESGDPSILKEALAYSKVIRSEPTVGLNAPPVVNISIDTKPVQKFIDVQASPEEVFNWDGREATIKDDA